MAMLLLALVHAMAVPPWDYLAVKRNVMTTLTVLAGLYRKGQISVGSVWKDLALHMVLLAGCGENHAETQQVNRWGPRRKVVMV